MVVIHSSAVVMLESKPELYLGAEVVMMSDFLESIYAGESTTHSGVQNQCEHVYSLTGGPRFSTH